MKQQRAFHGDTLTALLFLLPITIFVVFFMVIPSVQNMIYSVVGADGTFDHFRGFRIFLSQNRFLVNIKNTLLYAVCSVVLIIPTGILCAHLITDDTKFVKILRPIFMIPWVIPYVCSGILFRTMFHGQGPITMLLKALTGQEIMFLSDPNLAMVAVVLHQFWRSLPFTMLMVAAGLTTIPNGLYEAATIDGANRWQQFTKITFPLIKSHVFIVTLMITNGAMQDSESIFTINFGGPGNATETVALRLYKDAFRNYNQDYAAILSVILLCIALVFIILYGQVMRVSEENIYE